LAFGDFVLPFFLLDGVVVVTLEAAEATDVEDDRDREVTAELQLALLAVESDCTDLAGEPLLWRKRCKVIVFMF
jgi:hypothetical protein